MGKKVRISDESVNCYGSRIITSGIDLSLYGKNPVLLYMHDRSQGVVGKVENLKVENGELTGELEFDEASPLSVQLKKQYDFGSMRMVSASFKVLETSSDASLVMEGQTAETVTRSLLFEVSAVDIGGNHNAIVLLDSEGNQLELADKGGSNLLPLLDKNIVNNPLKNKKVEMELKDLAIKLGLKETATEEEVNAKLASLSLAAGEAKQLKSQVSALQSQQEAVQLAAITAAVDTAIQEKRLNADLKDHFVKLGQQVGLDNLNVTLAAMQPQGKISMVVGRDKDGHVVQLDDDDYSGYKKLSEVPQSKFLKLRDEHRDRYIELYKAEFGFEPDFK